MSNRLNHEKVNRQEKADRPEQQLYSHPARSWHPLVSKFAFACEKCGERFDAGTSGFYNGNQDPGKKMRCRSCNAA